MMIWRVLSVVSLSALFCSAAFAEFTLTPGVDLRMEYDDNIYLDSDNEQDDVITTVSPNVAMSWETSRLDVDLFASVSMEKYLDNTDEDRIGAGESDQASSLSAIARIYRENLYLKLRDKYTRVPIDEGGRGGEGNRTTNLTDSNTLEVNPYLQLELLKETQLQLGYTYTNQWYEESEGDDYESHSFAATLTKALSARLSMYLNGSYKQYRPKNPDDVLIENDGGAYDFDEEIITVGLTFMATERLTLNGSYGHTWLDYDVRSDTDSNTWSASADYEISSSYTVGTAYAKSYVVSVEDGPSETDRISAYLEYNDSYIIKGSIFGSSSDYVEIDRSDDSYGATLSGELPFNDKTGVTGMLRYTNFDRSGLDDEEYDRYSTRFALYYETRLGRISTGYIYNRNDSNLSNGDYTNNIVYIAASLRF